MSPNAARRSPAAKDQAVEMLGCAWFEGDEGKRYAVMALRISGPVWIDGWLAKHVVLCSEQN